jgi:excisionase family DNA binding protein
VSQSVTPKDPDRTCRRQPRTRLGHDDHNVKDGGLTADLEAHGWVRVSEVARLLSVSSRFVYKLIENGELPAVPLGRAVCVPRNALRQWMQDKEAAAEETRRRYGK